MKDTLIYFSSHCHITKCFVSEAIMFRVMLPSGSKKIITAVDFHELYANGCRKLGLAENEAITMKTVDGFEIEDDDGYQYALAEKADIFFHVEGGNHQEEEQHQQQEVPVQKVEQQSVQKKWPIVYQLPVLPPLLQSCIEQGQDGKKLRQLSSFTNAFLKFVMHDLQGYIPKDSL